MFRALAALAGQGPVERYGMTETLITLAARADGPRRAGLGRHAAGRGRGADRARPRTAIGELQVRGATLFDGYLGRGPVPLTADGWFATGDAAAVEDGQYRIVGRLRDDLIKCGGYRIGAGEIEGALLDHPSVTEAAVVGVPDDDLGQRIVAYVVGTDVRPDQLIDHVATQLSAHKRPREVRVVDALPRNAMGKIQKAKLA